MGREGLRWGSISLLQLAALAPCPRVKAAHTSGVLSKVEQEASLTPRPQRLQAWEAVHLATDSGPAGPARSRGAAASAAGRSLYTVFSVFFWLNVLAVGDRAEVPEWL